MSAAPWAVLGFVVVAGLFWLARNPASFSEAPALSGRVRYVVDGDSLYMNGHKAQVRLWGVDAPERGASGYHPATAFLRSIAEGQKITCRQIDRDKYGRTVARCFLSDGREINRLMIESGTAREYRHFTRGFYSRG